MRRPTGKIRGFSRYLRALNSEAESYSLPLKDDNCFDLCHHHFDFWGYGRRNWTLRQLHLDALFIAFERALSQAQASGAQQVFVSVAPMSEAEQDALYYYRPNPNGVGSPYEYPGVKWDVPPPAFLKPFVVGKPWQLGLIREANQSWWVVRAIGEPTV